MSERLLLPEKIYGFCGSEVNIYFANVFTCINPANYVFKFHCDIGHCGRNRWYCIPESKDAGTHPGKLEVFDESGLVARAECQLVISDPERSAGRKLSVLMIGDSMTDQTCYPAHLHTLCRQYGIELTMLGSNIPLKFREYPSGKMIAYPPAEELDGVRHEGLGGWSAATFLRRKEAIASDVYYHWNCASPFLNSNGVFDFKEYLEKHCSGIVPDVVMISLGGNDMLNINPENQQEVIAGYLKNMQELYRNLRKDAPDAIFGIGLEPYGATDQDAWGKSYGSKLFVWDRRNLVPPAYKQLTEIFAAEKSCSTMPLYTAVDPVYGYLRQEERCFAESSGLIVRGADGLHPNPAGYRQVANCTFGWLLAAIRE